MKITLGIVTLAVAAGGLNAQSLELSLLAPTTVDASDGSFIMQVITDGPGTHAAAASFELVGSDASGAIANMTWSAPTWAQTRFGNEGYLGNGDYGLASAGQVIFPIAGLLPDPNSTLPGTVIGQFTVDLTGLTGALEFQMVVSDNTQSQFVLQTYDESTETLFTGYDATEVMLGSASIMVVPAPAASTLFGLGALAATRRRRR